MSKNPQRILKKRYQVVPRTIVLIIRNGQVLLQKAPETKKIFPGYYNGIGGHIERGEDVFFGANRELFEEAGISCEDLKLMGTIMIDVNKTCGILLFVFSGEQISDAPRASSEGTVEWVEIARLNQYKVVDDIPELIQRIIRTRDSGRVFHGTYLYATDGSRISNFIE